MSHAPLLETPALLLHSTFGDTVDQLQRHLDPADFAIIRRSQSTRDVLKAVEDVLKQTNQAHSRERFAQLPKAMANVVHWLDKNSAVIDVVMQSSLQICGLGLMGLIWGGLKFLIIVRPISRCETMTTERQHPNLG